ncbi:MAG TPA: GLPGLI family protein [Ferruginibacter sp.]|nr:GLPGLI family protein [Ferruginibacter sp.]
MKQIACLATILIIVQIADAQVTEGKVIYEQKIDMWRRIPAEDAQTRSMIPQTRTTKFQLQFANNQSMYKAIEEEPDLSEQNNNGGLVIRMGGAAENEYYKNFTTQRAVNKIDMMGEIYLVDDSLRTFKWKLEEGETKTIMGHACKKATGKSERGTEITAWYAEDIQISAGPEQFNGLPGLILGIDANKGEIVYNAIAMDKKVEEKIIKAPSKGKKVTNAEFTKIQTQVMGNSNGPVRIRMN